MPRVNIEAILLEKRVEEHISRARIMEPRVMACVDRLAQDRAMNRLIL